MRYPGLPVNLVMLAALLVWVAGAGAQPVAGRQQAVPPPSIIDIPLRLSLEPLIAETEKLLPTQAGNWRS